MRSQFGELGEESASDGEVCTRGVFVDHRAGGMAGLVSGHPEKISDSIECLGIRQPTGRFGRSGSSTLRSSVNRWCCDAAELVSVFSSLPVRFGTAVTTA